MTADEFLAFENASADKHEFVRGEVFAMAGATEAHNAIVLNLAAWLRDRFRGHACRAFALDMKLRVDAADAFFYPDVFVTCDPRDRDDPLVKRHPTLIVEVLSESTAEYDRTDKFDDYQRLADLQEYVLVDSRERRVIVHRRIESGRWDRAADVRDGAVTFASVALTTTLAAIYDDTEVPEFRAARVAEVGAR